LVIPQAALKEGEEVGNPSENQGRGVTGSQGTRCINSAVSIRPPIPASPAQTQGAVLIVGAPVPHSFTDGCGTPPRGVCDREAQRRGSARRAPHLHRPPSRARSIRTRMPDRMAQRRGSAPRAPNPCCPPADTPTRSVRPQSMAERKRPSRPSSSPLALNGT